MPITAYSREAKCELDLTQWLARNGYSTKGALNISKIPQDLRIKATTEIECSCCEVIGASLVSESHSQKTGKQISQGHFRFGSNHHPFCDYFDESAETGSEYLTRFTDDKSEITKVIRQLVCNGIAAEIFTQADMRQMRVWFMHEKEKNSLIMPVTAELLQWYADASLMAIAYGSDYPFHPNQAQLSSFNWQESAKHEWARRNKHLFIDSAGRATHYAHKAIKRPLLLANRLEGKRVLDPTALREKYSDAVVLARFSAKHTFPGKKNCLPRLYRLMGYTR